MVKLLQSAGLAVKALTKPAASDSHEKSLTQSSTIEQHKESFTNATAQYFSLLSSVDVRLRRQIHALKEAEILPTKVASREGRAKVAVNPQIAAMAYAPNAKQKGGNKGAVTGGGLGSLDVSWLNSRNDNVGEEMEAELWEEARRFVERLEEAKATGAHDVDMRRDGYGTARSPPQDENSNGEIVQT